MTAQRTIVEDRYTFSGFLGSGGTADVYRARDHILRREVAIKILRKEYSQDEEFVKRFRREAWSTASLSHPRIVQVHDMGCSEGDAYYTVMECVEGGTLKERLLEKGAFHPGEAATTALRIADALRAAHGRGIVHRDIKPQNILMTRTGDIKVADFGIARSSSSDTAFGMVLGTADYMSPEQGAGGALGPRSDLYSLGVVLYEMLTGERPFEADTPLGVVMRHVHEAPRPPRELKPSIPEEINAVVVKLLAKNPEDRYDDAAQLIEDLKEIGAEDGGPPAAGESLSAEGRGQSPETAVAMHTRRLGKRRVNGRRKWGALLALLASTAMLGVLAFGYYGFAQPLDAVGAPNPPASPPAAEEANIPQSTSPDGMFVHRATPESTSDNTTYLDDPLTNGEPDAFLLATQNWNPGEDGGTYNDHPVGVWYDSGRGQWAIFNQDLAEMPENAAFNVVVWTET
ncbi:MAG: serine/threonine protein kinase [Rubrobacter sp.]|nr:serine/threonine protein kinase [Rubrobacter sp.]